MDDFFGPPYIRRDEWRDRPYRHRYVHGGFNNTDTRFTFYFPEPSAYEGRFVQFLQGGHGGSEYQGVVTGGLHVAADNAAYYLETNQGHIGNDLSGLKGDPSILEWRASAQAARYARDLAAEMYGEKPHHGYVFGGSGGAMRSVSCLEAAPDLWDGAVPFMINRPGLINYNWSIAAWVGSVLGDKVRDVVDAMDPGGGGNPFAVLDNDVQRQALAALYRAGYCRGAESQLEANSFWILGMQLAWAEDRKYFADFWTEPGYEGKEKAPLLEALLIETKAKVRELKAAKELGGEGMFEDLNAAVLGRMPSEAPMGAVVDVPVGLSRLLGATMTVATGKAAGRRMLCSGAVKGALVAIMDPVGFRDIQPGDIIDINNRDFVAYLFFHRHRVDERYPAMRQFFIDSKPMYAQRPTGFDVYRVPSGKFNGKMILLQHAHDRECWPNCAEPYIQDVRRHLGNRVDDHFRIWWVENAAHLVPMSPAALTRLINYQGPYAQAVKDVVAWVEKGIAPPPSSAYSLEDSGLLVLPRAAAERKGVQPVISATANGGLRAEVKVGDTVHFEAMAEAPPGAGKIASGEWDFDGLGSWPVKEKTADGTRETVRSAATHAFQKPGTYFAVFRAGVQREGRIDDGLRRIHNLARVRVVVSA